MKLYAAIDLHSNNGVLSIIDDADRVQTFAARVPRRQRSDVLATGVTQQESGLAYCVAVHQYRLEPRQSPTTPPDPHHPKKSPHGDHHVKPREAT